MRVETQFLSSCPRKRTSRTANAVDPLRSLDSRFRGSDDSGDEFDAFIFNRSSRLQLALELVEKAPIGALQDQLLRVRFDKADIVQAEGIEANRVLRVVFAPFVEDIVA